MTPRQHEFFSTRLTLLLFVVLALSACAHSPARSPMRREAIRATQLLKVAWIDFGSGVDRRGFQACPEAFPGIEVIGEPSLIPTLRKDGILPEHLLEWESDFPRFRSIQGLHLLFLVFEAGPKIYLRTVNYLSESVSTVVLDVPSPKCEELLRKERVVVFESHPPIADVFLAGRRIGEAPVWVWLRNGNYEVSCALPGQIFKPIDFAVPGPVRVLCQRENTRPATGADQADETTAEEKAGSVLIYLLGAAASIAVIVLPILFLF